MKEIKLTKGQVALVDDEDYDFLIQWKWLALYCKNGNNYYACRHAWRKEGFIKNTVIMMSRIIAKTPSDMVCDHKDHNTLNNQKYNLRNCKQYKNIINRKIGIGFSSKYKGVKFHKNTGKYEADIKFENKNYYLGLFNMFSLEVPFQKVGDE